VRADPKGAFPVADIAAARRVFDKFDRNGDGKVTPAEFQQAMLEMGDYHYTVGTARAVLADKDQDDDGLLSFDEFLAVYEAAEDN
jgi:Ca2+-binding EF-hand superfamily protein